MRALSKPRRSLVLAAGAGVVTFAVVGYAASLTVTNDTLASGSAATAACNAGASVTYTTAYESALPGYEVATATITSAAGCSGMAYRATLAGAGDASLGEATGVLDGSGVATPSFAAQNVSAALVTRVHVVITG